MSELGTRWKTVRLGDVAKTSSGGTPKRGVSAYYGGGIPWVKSGELGDSTVYETEETITEAGLKGSSAKLFPKGTLCVALYGATVGKLGILGIDAATNQAVCGIFLPPELDTYFSYYFLESKRRELIDMGKGGAQPNISQEIVRNIEILLPQVDEQRKIVSEIEKQFTRLDAGVTALKRVQANLKRYRASVLKAACEGRLVPTEHELARKEGRTYETGEQLLARILTERRQKWQGRGKYKEPAKPDATKLPQLPKGWTWATIEQIAASIVDCPHSTPKWRTHGRVCVRTTEFRPGFLDLSKVRFVSEEAYQERIARLEPHAGDILYSREGGILGIACQVPQGTSLCLGQRMMLIRPSAYVVSRFVMDWLNAPFILNLVKSLISGSAAPHLNVGEIRQFSIPLAPLSEQKRIVAEVERRLSVIDELDAVVSANLQRATRLRQSILQTSFSGINNTNVKANSLV